MGTTQTHAVDLSIFTSRFVLALQTQTHAVDLSRVKGATGHKHTARGFHKQQQTQDSNGNTDRKRNKPTFGGGGRGRAKANSKCHLFPPATHSCGEEARNLGG